MCVMQNHARTKVHVQLVILALMVCTLVVVNMALSERIAKKVRGLFNCFNYKILLIQFDTY